MPDSDHTQHRGDDRRATARLSRVRHHRDPDTRRSVDDDAARIDVRRRLGPRGRSDRRTTAAQPHARAAGADRNARTRVAPRQVPGRALPLCTSRSRARQPEHAAALALATASGASSPARPAHESRSLPLVRVNRSRDPRAFQEVTS